MNNSVRGNVSVATAQEAASAGVGRALQCAAEASDSANGSLSQVKSSFGSAIKANTNCVGDMTTGSEYIASANGMRSSYEITKRSVDDTMLKLEVTGRSERLAAPSGIPVAGQEYTRTARINIPIAGTIQETIEPGSSDTTFVTQVDIGNQHVCAVVTAKAYCWGNGGSYRLGTGSTASQYKPAEVPFSEEVQQVTAGETHSCLVTRANQAYCWGNGADYMMGNNSTSTRVGPSYVAVPNGAKKISAGSHHTCAINTSDKLYCWGSNNNHKLGVGTSTDCGWLICDGKEPLAVYRGDMPLNAIVKDISAGDDHTCAVATASGGGNGKAYCWGSGSSGVGGWGNTSRQNTPTSVQGIPSSANVTKVVAGNTHTCALASGDVYCWGYGQYRKLGRGTFTGTATTAEIVTGFPSSVSVTTDILTGEHHTCSLSGPNAADTKLYCWGWNKEGQRALTPSDTMNGTPTLGLKGDLGSSKKFKSIASFGRAWHNCGITTSSELLCWGDGGYGVLGYGGTSSSGSPKLVDLGGVITQPNVYIDVSAGDAHSCGVANSKSYCWGYNLSGRTGIAPWYSDSSSFIPRKAIEDLGSEIGPLALQKTSAGYDHTCAVASARVLCWGDNSYGNSWFDPFIVGGKAGYPSWTRSHIPKIVSGTSGTATDVSAGFRHSCAVISGVAKCWGVGSDGRLGNNSTSKSTSAVSVTGPILGKSVQQIGAGNAFSCARTSEVRGVYCWGSNGNRQLGSSGFTAGTSLVSRPIDTSSLGSRTVTDLSVGQYHACVVASGEVFCWGSNAYGKTSQSSTGNPVKVTLSGQAKQVSAGYNHTCAVMTSGEAYCWGRNSENSSGSYGGRLGTGSVYPQQQSTPQKVTAGEIGSDTKFSRISAGNRHTCAVTTDSLPYCWGYSGHGRLGSSSHATSASPIPVFTGNPPPEVIIETANYNLDIDSAVVY